jgi:hypothetical protein
LSHVIFIIQFLNFKKTQNVNQVFSQIHVRVAYLFLYLRSRYICYGIWLRVILCDFHILSSKISWFCLVFTCHSTCDIIPKLSINMETYPHLVSSQIPHIYYFIIYLYSKTIIALCNILNSQNIAGNIFVNEQCHRKL